MFFVTNAFFERWLERAREDSWEMGEQGGGGKTVSEEKVTVFDDMVGSPAVEGSVGGRGGVGAWGVGAWGLVVGWYRASVSTKKVKSVSGL
jgi:hypothetical protein